VLCYKNHQTTTTIFVSYLSTLDILWGHLRQTYCQHSLHRQTLLLVGSHAALSPFGTVFPHLYTLLTAAQDLYVRKTFVAGPLFTPNYKFITYLLT